MGLPRLPRPPCTPLEVSFSLFIAVALCFLFITMIPVSALSAGRAVVIKSCFVTRSSVGFLHTAAVTRSGTISSSSTSTANRSATRRWASIEEEVDPGVVEGTNLRVLKYPHPALRAPNVDVTEEELKDGTIAKIAKEMLLVMYASVGMGLAAPQVGINKRLMVFNISGDPKKWLLETILVNPKIVQYSDSKDIHYEGCLSFPKMNGPVERSKAITVEALNIKGKKITKKYKGWDARLFQHEYDHLDGKVYIDRLIDEEKLKVQPRLDELIAEFGEGGAL